MAQGWQKAKWRYHSPYTSIYFQSPPYDVWRCSPKRYGELWRVHLRVHEAAHNVGRCRVDQNKHQSTSGPKRDTVRWDFPSYQLLSGIHPKWNIPIWVMYTYLLNASYFDLPQMLFRPQQVNFMDDISTRINFRQFQKKKNKIFFLLQGWSTWRHRTKMSKHVVL